MQTIKLFKIVLFGFLITTKILLAADTSVWVFTRCAPAFVGLNLHQPGTLAKIVGAMPIGESALFFEALRGLKFGGADIQGVDPRFTSIENGSDTRSWRMWEYLAALLVSSGLQWASVSDYALASANLSPHTLFTQAADGGDTSAQLWATSVDPKFDNNRTKLVGGFVQAAWNKYVKVVTDASTRKIGAQAKIQALSGTQKIDLTNFDVQPFSQDGEKPLYLSVDIKNMLVSTTKVDPADRITAFIPDARVQPFYKEIFGQNNIISLSGTTSTKTFDGAAQTGTSLLTYWKGLALKMGFLKDAFSDPGSFSSKFICSEKSPWDQTGYPNGAAAFFHCNGSQQGRSNGTNNYGFKNAFPRWLTFNGSGFSNIFTGTFAYGWFIIDTPLLGGLTTPEKVAKYTGLNGKYVVYGPDAQAYRSDRAAFLLKYRDACYDVSGGGNVVAIISGWSDDKDNNAAFAPKWLVINTLPDTLVPGTGEPQDEYCASQPDTNTTPDQVETKLTADRGDANSYYNSLICSNAVKYIPVPAGEDYFSMVEVGMDGAVWVLGSTGKPYYIKNNNTAVPMSSPLHGNLTFTKIAVGAHQAFRVLGITAKGEVYILIDAESGLWQDTGQTGSHASIDKLGNWAILGLDSTIYIAKDNATAMES